MNVVIGFVVIIIIISVYYYRSQPVVYKGKLIREYLGRPVVHLFWSGGFDSTYRLLHLLLVEKAPVQPIYVVLNPFCDLDGMGWLRGRKNTLQEILTMRKLRGMIFEKFPGARGLLLPTIFVFKCDVPEFVKGCMCNLYDRGYFSRPANQHSIFSSISQHWRLPCELCSEAGDSGILTKAVEKYAVPDTSRIAFGQLVPNWKLPTKMDAEGQRTVGIFNYMRFPLIKTTKEQMLWQAKQNGFDDFLRYTVSCWYPSGRGEPCGQCTMCRERLPF